MKRKRIFGKPQLSVKDMVEVMTNMGKHAEAQELLDKLAPMIEICPSIFTKCSYNICWNGGYKLIQMKWGNRNGLYPLTRIKYHKSVTIIPNPNYIGERLQPRKEQS